VYLQWKHDLTWAWGGLAGPLFSYSCKSCQTQAIDGNVCELSGQGLVLRAAEIKPGQVLSEGWCVDVTINIDLLLRKKIWKFRQTTSGRDAICSKKARENGVVISVWRKTTSTTEDSFTVHLRACNKIYL